MGDEVWTVRRILNWMESYLASHGDENARVSSQWLVADALGCTRMQLFLDMDRPLSLDERDVLRSYTKRRASGEPLQYITGTTDFRYITIDVSHGVLIPRPETEVLVSVALSLLPGAPKPQDAFDDAIAKLLLKSSGKSIADSDTEGPGDVGVDEFELQQPDYALVADICTGSGCIACSIASEHPLTRVIATDISPEAVELAKRNVDKLNLSSRIDVLESDLGSAVDPEKLGHIDLVVSNPPYVPSCVLASLPHEVSAFEPELALDGGADGLVVFRRLLDWCSIALKAGAPFAFELHETCLDEAARLAAEAGFVDIRILADLAEKPRILVGFKPRCLGEAATRNEG